MKFLMIALTLLTTTSALAQLDARLSPSSTHLETQEPSKSFPFPGNNQTSPVISGHLATKKGDKTIAIIFDPKASELDPMDLNLNVWRPGSTDMTAMNLKAFKIGNYPNIVDPDCIVTVHSELDRNQLLQMKVTQKGECYALTQKGLRPSGTYTLIPEGSSN